MSIIIWKVWEYIASDWRSMSWSIIQQEDKIKIKRFSNFLVWSCWYAIWNTLIFTFEYKEEIHNTIDANKFYVAFLDYVGDRIKKTIEELSMIIVTKDSNYCLYSWEWESEYYFDTTTDFIAIGSPSEYAKWIYMYDNTATPETIIKAIAKYDTTINDNINRIDL